MAERVISTKMIIQGEKEYRAQVAQINRELKTLDSQLKLVESEFKGQQNTMAALQAKHKALTDIIAKQAEKYKAETEALAKNKQYQQEAAAQADKVRQKMEELNRTTSEADKKTDQYEQQMKELQKQLDASVAAEAAAAAAVERHTAAANNAQVKLNNLNGSLKENDKYLEEAKSSSDGCAKSIDAMGKEVKDTGSDFEEMGEQGKQSIDALASALAAAGVVGTLKEIADGIRTCLDASVEFESAMTGVAKTTDLSGDELTAMSEQIKELSQTIPLTTTELAQIAEAGGQLGIAKENLMSFTEVMGALAASTNMASDEAAVMLAQLSGITGMDASLYSNLGSALVDLGNNFETNEKKIAEMALATAAAGTNAGMSVPDILALSAAVNSLGIEAETGGNNMSMLIGDMQTAVETGKDLELWAEAAGMSAQEFAALWGTDAAEALRRFIAGLGTTEESARATLSALGQNDARLVRMITSLNNAEKNTGKLTKALQMSESAWVQNTALMKEAELRYSTTESKQQILTNSINNLKIAVGDQLKPAMNELLDVGTDWAQWATKFVESNQQIVPVMTAVVAAVGTFVGGLTLLATVVTTVQKALAAMNLVLSANPWILAASAIAAVGVAIGTLALTSQDANKEVEALVTAQENLNTAMETAESSYTASVNEIEAQSNLIGTLCDRLDALAAKSSLTADEQAEQSRIVAQLNQLLPGLNASIDSQTGVLNTSTEAIRQQTQAWKEQQIALAVAEQQQAVMQAYSAALIELEKVEIARGKKQQELAVFETNRANALNQLAKATGISAEGLLTLSAADRSLQLENAISTQGIWEQGEALRNELAYVEAANESIASLQGEVSAMDAAYASATETVKKAEAGLEEINEVERNLIETSGQMPAAAEETANALADQAEAYQPVLDRLNELVEYQNKVRESTKAQVDSVVSGFEMIVPPAEKSVEDTIAALNSQIVYMDNFGSLVQQALSMGYKASLIAELSDGSEQSSAILQGLVNANEEKVAEVNAAWDGKLEQSEQLATELANAKLEADAGYQTLVDAAIQAANDLNQADLAYSAGAATVQGLVNGLNSKKASLQSVINSINSIVRGINSASVGGGAKAGGGKTSVSSHASGIDYVPYDGYLAELHEGERVQTAMEARAQRALDMTNYGAMRRFERMMEAAGTTNNSSVVVNVTVNGGGADMGKKVADEVTRRLRYKGVIS